MGQHRKAAGADCSGQEESQAIPESSVRGQGTSKAKVTSSIKQPELLKCEMPA